MKPQIQFVFSWERPITPHATYIQTHTHLLDPGAVIHLSLYLTFLPWRLPLLSSVSQTSEITQQPCLVYTSQHNPALWVV